MSPTTEELPSLDAPGAGLPGPMLFVARRLFALKCRFGKREGFIADFAAERAAIANLLGSCPADQRATRILVPRLRGLEDSSRYWSAWMTLDHLRICNEAFAHVITELSHDRQPDLVVRTEDVKPDPAVGRDVEAGYEQANDHFLEVLRDLPDLRTRLQLAHPWFGPLDAFRWLALATMHMAIHRAQLEAILGRLPK